MRKPYGSDVTREQFAHIESYLLSARQRTKPRQVDLYEVFCAVLYTLKNGCAWRNLPGDFPKWQTVYKYYCQWRATTPDRPESLLEQALKKSGGHGTTGGGTALVSHAVNPRRAKRAKQ
jgi:transposase